MIYSHTDVDQIHLPSSLGYWYCTGIKKRSHFGPPLLYRSRRPCRKRERRRKNQLLQMEVATTSYLTLTLVVSGHPPPPHIHTHTTPHAHPALLVHVHVSTSLHCEILCSFLPQVWLILGQLVGNRRRSLHRRTMTSPVERLRIPGRYPRLQFHSPRPASPPHWLIPGVAFQQRQPRLLSLLPQHSSLRPS